MILLKITSVFHAYGLSRVPIGYSTTKLMMEPMPAARVGFASVDSLSYLCSSSCIKFLWF